MEMKVDVSISLDGKRVIGTVYVDDNEWQVDPFQTVLKELNNQHSLELSRFYEDKSVDVRHGETIMDLTDRLDADKLKSAMSWMEIDISKSGEVNAYDSEVIIGLMNRLSKYFPVLNESAVCKMCYPYGDGREEPLSTLIPHLNDSHELTVAEIADWLETLDSDIGIDYASSV